MEKKTMKALFMEGALNIFCDDTEIPEPYPGEARIKVMATGVCGGELKMYLGHRDPKEPIPAGMAKGPHIPGHEYAGIVDKVSEGVTNVKVGDRVAIYPTKYCGECAECKEGKYNLCNLRKVPKPGDGHSQGGHAEYACFRSQNLIPLKDNVTFVQGAMIEPLAVSMHAANRAGDLEGKNVAIMGMGSLGFFLLECLKLKGVKNIVAIDVVESKIEKALEHGATHGFNSTEENVAQKIRDAAGPIDAVFECVMIQKTLDTSLKIVRDGGSIVACGLGAYEVTFVWRQLIDHEINIIPSITYTTEMHDCAELLAEGKLDIDYIASVFPLEYGPQAFKDMEKDGPYIKIVFIPPHGDEQQ